MNVAAVIVTRGDVDLDPVRESLPSEWEHVLWVNGQGCHSFRPGGWNFSRDDYEYQMLGVSETHDFGRMNVETMEPEFPDLAVFGRYEAIKHATADIIMVQDDDCILAPESFDALLAAYQPGHIVANMPARFRPHYPDSCLVGFGAIFDRDLPRRAFMQYEEWPPRPRLRFAVPDGHPAHWRAAEHNLVKEERFLRTADVVFTTLTPRILLDLPYTDREFASDANRMWKQPDHYGERVRMLELAREVRDRVPA